MLDSKKIKEAAKRFGADIVGIGSMDRFEGAPKQFDPRYIFPDAKSIIVMGFRHFRGVFRGIEEGTFWTSYCSLGYASVNFFHQPFVLWNLCRLIEDEGYEAIPIPNNFPWCNQKASPGFSKPVSPEVPHPNVFMHIRIAAYIAGLGEIGWSKVFLTPEFGPRQRLAAVITDLPLEPDPLVEPGTICDRCMECVKACSVGAIPHIKENKVVRVKIAGKEIEWADIDIKKCLVGFMYPPKKYNPFIVTEEDERMFDIEKGYKVQKYKVPPIYFYARALEGARGCIRACMIHLEKRGKIKSKFKEPFRKRKPWVIEWEK